MQVPARLLAIPADPLEPYPVSPNQIDTYSKRQQSSKGFVCIGRPIGRIIRKTWRFQHGLPVNDGLYVDRLPYPKSVDGFGV